MVILEAGLVAVSTAVREVLGRIAREGPTEDELLRSRAPLEKWLPLRWHMAEHWHREIRYGLHRDEVSLDYRSATLERIRELARKSHREKTLGVANS